jgi:hypothetical protein
LEVLGKLFRRKVSINKGKRAMKSGVRRKRSSE